MGVEVSLSEHIKATAFTQDLNGGRRAVPSLGSLGGCCLEGFKNLKLYLNTMLLKKQTTTNNKKQQINKRYASERETIGFLCSRLEALYPGDHLMAVWDWIGLGWS